MLKRTAQDGEGRQVQEVEMTLGNGTGDGDDEQRGLNGFEY